MRNKFLVLFCAMFLSLGLYAQISGVVLEDATGEPIIGASVLEKGTSNGTITDIDGNFTLNVSAGTLLEVAYLGYVGVEVAASEGMTVRLKEDTYQLQEVVAIGYGSQKKKEVTGSVASIKAENFNQGVQSNPVGLLQGKVAGLNIIRSTGDPTSTGYDIQIRGFSTLDKGAGTSPLFIVDGVPVSSIDNISPDEIASMDVLKDGSAAAIYGTRGTNGVILITTKRGDGFSDSPATFVEYSGYVNLGWITSKTGMATASEFRNISQYTDGKISATDFGASTDWMDAVTRDVALTHNHSVAISGSHKKFNYRASVGYKNAEGIAKVTQRQEILAKLAAQQKALDGWLDLAYDLSYMHYRNDKFCGDFTMAATLNPTFPIRDAKSPTGYYVEGLSTGQTNPVEGMNQKESYEDGNYFRGSIKATVNIKAVEGLKVSGFAALEDGDNYSYYANKALASTGFSGTGGEAGRSGSKISNQLYEATIDYANGWNGHNLVALGGFSYQYFLNDEFSIVNNGFATEEMKYYSIGDGDPEKTHLTVGSNRYSHSLAAMFFRLNYNYNDKYLLSASVRYEGSSRFGENNKWGWFPAVSAGWRIKGEPFMANASWCNDLKLRLGFGVTGNDLNESLRSVARYTKSDVIEYNGSSVNTYVISQNVNPDLKWEKKFEYNVGIDYAFLNNRLYGSLDGYFRQTKDLLWEYEVPTPPYQYSTLLANAGEMKSYGVEVAITGVPVKHGDWTWTTTPTLAWNKNIISKLSDPAKGFNYTETLAGYVSGNKFNSMYTQILVEDESVGEFYGYKFEGFQSDGTFVFRTPGGGLTTNPTEADKQYLGSAQPVITYGWNNTLQWKNLDLSIFVRGVLGNKLLNVTRWQYTPDGSSSSISENFFMKDISSTKGGGGKAVYANYNYFTDFWLENGSYLKLDNITLGYTFNFKENKYVSRLRLYATGQNLGTITKYSGQDPEVSTTSVTSAGIDYVDFYPRTASFLFGVNLNLF